MTAKVLIVEDEPAIALAIESILSRVGYAITACVGSVDEALDVIERRECDVALLDTNLRGETVEPVAAALRGRHGGGEMARTLDARLLQI